VTVRSAELQNGRYDKGVQVRYSVRGDDEPTATAMVERGGCTPQFSHSRVVTLPCVVDEHLDYFDSGCITFLVYARQVDSPPDKRLQKMSTRVRSPYSPYTVYVLLVATGFSEAILN